MRDKFHKLKYREFVALHNQGVHQCGYIRLPRINKNQTFVRGKCSLTGEKCQYKLPQRTYDCKTARRYRGYWRAARGLEGNL